MQKQTTRRTWPAAAIWLAVVVCTVEVAAAPLFEDDSVIAVTLTGPMNKLLGDDGDEREQWPFELAVGGQVIDVQLKLRGNFRRKTCRFAPIRLNFKKDSAKGTPFDGQDKLKLVTHCQSARAYELNTLEEFNAYRIFNLITDASFQVRMLHITYVGEKRKPETKYGFVIEDVDALAERLGGKPFEPPKISREQLDLDYATRVAIFQYLIGNTDFSLVAAVAGEPCCHNAKLIERDGNKLLSIPYDFDMAGLINAPYATPNPQFNIRTVRQRKYWGFCTDSGILASAVDQFRGIKDEVERLFANTPGMSGKEVARALSYVSGFYKELDKDQGKRFASQCRD